MYHPHPDTFMRRLRLLVAALTLAFTWHAHALSISIDANLLKDANGNAMPTTGLVILVASTSDSTFNAPTPLNFVSGDDVIIAKWDLSSASGGGFDTPGVLSAFINTTVPVSASNPLQLYWYPTLNINSTAPGQDAPYGTYTDATGIDGSAKWFGSSPSDTITLRFLTSDANTTFDNTGSNPPSTGNAANVTPTAIAILSQPASTIQNLGDTTHFSVVASGTSLVYQWRKNDINMTDGGNVFGSTTQNLTLANVSTSDAATYSVFITNSEATVTSANVTLAVDDLVITGQPASFTAACGTVWPCLGVTASASSGVIYQWYTPDPSGTPIAGATNATLCLNNTFASAGNYSVLVTSGFGNSITSFVATVTVTDTTAPTITLTGPNPQTVCKDSAYTEQGATATDTCDGSVIVTPSGTVDTSTVGAHTITYTASDSHGNISTATRIVNVNDCTVASDPAITSQPQSQTVVTGQKNVAMSVAVTGTPSSNPKLSHTGGFHYQWRSINSHGDKPITGATNATLTFKAAITSGNAGSYYCIVTNDLGSATSAYGTLTVYAAPTVSGPANLTKIAGNIAVFKATAGPSAGTSTSVGGPFTFVWTKNGVPISSGGNIVISSSGRISTLTIYDVQSSDVGTYLCTVGNSSAATATAPNNGLHGVLTVQSDDKNPSVAIVHPTVNFHYTNGLPSRTTGTIVQTNNAPDLDIDGTASDKGLITNVTLVRLQDTNTDIVTLVYRTNASGLMIPGSVHWTNHVTLIDGTNTYQASATDSAGHITGSVLRTYYMCTPVTVTINVQGTGKVTGAASPFGKPAEGVNTGLFNQLGYKVTASPTVSSHHFQNWTDGDGNTIGTLPTLIFTATNNMVINAAFQ